MSRLQEQYKSEILKNLYTKLNCNNIHEVPKISKIVLNIGLGEAKDDVKIVDKAQEELSLIAGQRAVKTKAKKAIAGFKIRAGMPLGVSVTLRNKIKLKKGDEVIVLTGKDKGKKGKIVKIIPDIRKVVVSDINKYKKHQKPGNNEPGGIIEKDMPMHISNVAFFDAVSNKGARIGYNVNKDGKKVRINKKSGKEI